MSLLSKIIRRLKSNRGEDSGSVRRREEVFVPGLPHARLVTTHKHFHEPLDSPVWRDAGEAEHMQPDDPVLGLYIDGQAWAFPWWILKNHHVANLTLNGRAVLVSLCEICASGAAFDARVNGAPHSFRIAGKYNGSHFIRDYETDSSWAPFTGECLEGALKGEVLERLPLVLAAWSDWQTEQPSTKVLYGPQEWRQGHGSSYRPDSDGSQRGARGFRSFLIRPLDERLHHQELVLGVKVNGESRAYPLSELDVAGPVTNDMLGGRAITIVHRPNTYIATAFSRYVDGETVTLHAPETGVIADREHGRRWNYAGELMPGSDGAPNLEFVWSGTEKWYIWAGFHPETDIFSSAGPPK